LILKPVIAIKFTHQKLNKKMISKLPLVSKQPADEQLALQALSSLLVYLYSAPCLLLCLAL
jgi:hypothetical protein